MEIARSGTIRDMRQDRDWIFWTTLLVTFVLVIHNGTEPVFLLAFALLPVLILAYVFKKSLIPLVVYILVFGVLGRYTRYMRETYASDAILAVRDFIGYFLAGKNVYHEIVMAQSGPTPFTYLPFSLFWYLSAQVIGIDLRFFEMMVSCMVAPLVYFIGRGVKTARHVPLVAVVALTPFLLDLSADGSNDNSAVVLLLISIACLVWSKQKKNAMLAMCSAIALGLAATFKHYVAFYLLFFIPYLWQNKNGFMISSKKYLFITGATIAVLSIPFFIASPSGFWRSLFFIEIGNFHTTWGWNIWVLLRDAAGVIATKQTMWLVRTIVTLITAVGFWKFFRLHSLGRVCIAAGTTLLVYLVLSNWTTYAYFTFLLPILILGFLP